MASDKTKTIAIVVVVLIAIIIIVAIGFAIAKCFGVKFGKMFGGVDKIISLGPNDEPDANKQVWNKENPDTNNNWNMIVHPATNILDFANTDQPFNNESAYYGIDIKLNNPDTNKRVFIDVGNGKQTIPTDNIQLILNDEPCEPTKITLINDALAKYTPMSMQDLVNCINLYTHVKESDDNDNSNWQDIKLLYVRFNNGNPDESLSDARTRLDNVEANRRNDFKSNIKCFVINGDEKEFNYIVLCINGKNETGKGIFKFLNKNAKCTGFLIKQDNENNDIRPIDQLHFVINGNDQDRGSLCSHVLSPIFMRHEDRCIAIACYLINELINNRNISDIKPNYINNLPLGTCNYFKLRSDYEVTSSETVRNARHKFADIMPYIGGLDDIYVFYFDTCKESANTGTPDTAIQAIIKVFNDFGQQNILNGAEPLTNPDEFESLKTKEFNPNKRINSYFMYQCDKNSIIQYKNTAQVLSTVLSTNNIKSTDDQYGFTIDKVDTNNKFKIQYNFCSDGDGMFFFKKNNGGYFAIFIEIDEGNWVKATSLRMVNSVGGSSPDETTYKITKAPIGISDITNMHEASTLTDLQTYNPQNQSPHIDNITTFNRMNTHLSKSICNLFTIAQTFTIKHIKINGLIDIEVIFNLSKMHNNIRANDKTFNGLAFKPSLAANFNSFGNNYFNAKEHLMKHPEEQEKYENISQLEFNQYILGFKTPTTPGIEQQSQEEIMITRNNELKIENSQLRIELDTRSKNASLQNTCIEIMKACKEYTNASGEELGQVICEIIESGNINGEIIENGNFTENFINYLHEVFQKEPCFQLSADDIKNYIINNDYNNLHNLLIRLDIPDENKHVNYPTPQELLNKFADLITPGCEQDVIYDSKIIYDKRAKINDNTSDLPESPVIDKLQQLIQEGAVCYRQRCIDPDNNNFELMFYLDFDCQYELYPIKVHIINPPQHPNNPESEPYPITDIKSITMSAKYHNTYKVCYLVEEA